MSWFKRMRLLMIVACFAVVLGAASSAQAWRIEVSILNKTELPMTFEPKVPALGVSGQNDQAIIASGDRPTVPVLDDGGRFARQSCSFRRLKPPARIEDHDTAHIYATGRGAQLRLNLRYRIGSKKTADQYLIGRFSIGPRKSEVANSTDKSSPLGVASEKEKGKVSSGKGKEKVAAQEEDLYENRATLETQVVPIRSAELRKDLDELDDNRFLENPQMSALSHLEGQTLVVSVVIGRRAERSQTLVALEEMGVIPGQPSPAATPPAATPPAATQTYLNTAGEPRLVRTN